jgi:hypothetical protein
MWLWGFLFNKHSINHARHSKWKCVMKTYSSKLKGT